MALRTSVGDGNWSVAGTWDTGVPVNGDTFAIAAGHTVTFDVDQSGFAAGMGASTIAATGTLTASTAAGAYYLKMNGDLTVNGTLRAGTDEDTPYPSTCTFTVGFNNGSNSIVINDTTGQLLLYCNEPTYKYVTLTAQSLATDTTLTVDTDVTADIWAAADTVAVSDTIVPPASTVDNEEHTINTIAAGVITLNAGVATDKEIGAKVVLVTRNIRLINSTDYAVKAGKSCSVSCEIYNCTNGYSGIDDSFIGGTTHFTNGVAGWSLVNSVGLITDMAMSHVGVAQVRSYVTCSDIVTATGSIVAGCHYVFHGCTNVISYTHISGSVQPYAACNAVAINATVENCQFGLHTCNNVFLTADVTGTTYGIYAGTEIVGSSCEIDSMWYVKSARFYNVLFSGATEFLYYNLPQWRAQFNYVESFDHDQVTNAYKAWTLGGTVTSFTTSPPTGHTIWYELAAEDTTQTYPVFRQYETVVLPGTAIEVAGKIRIAGGEDLSSSGLEPQLQIIDKFADPLVDSTQSALDYDIPDDVTGAETGWQDVSVIWANQGDSPKNVIVRMIAYNDGGVDDVDVDTCWSVACYQDQISEILNRVKRLGLTSEF